MRIGIYFTPQKKEGGVYQYSISILEALSKIKKHNIVVLTTSSDIPDKYKKLKNLQIVDIQSVTRDISIKARNLGSSFLAQIAPHLLSNLYKLGWYNLITPLYKMSMTASIKSIDSLNLDLVFYPTSSILSFLTKPASVVSIHDFQHRSNPHFKEVSAGGRWAHREYSFSNIGKKAFKIFTDSEIGKQDMLTYYGTPAEKVVSLPYLPLPHLKDVITQNKLDKISKKLKLPQKFIYYPAKFWPHKNHINLIKALNILKKDGKKINLVLTGSKEADFSSFNEVMLLIKKLHLQDQVKYLGYVTNLEVSALYKMSQAVIMPTYNGTTNIPVLEAWSTGTPILYSDIRGCREQLGDAGLLIDPFNPQDIAKKIRQIYNNNNLRKVLIAKGKRRISKWTPSQFNKKIRDVINAFIATNAS